MVADCLNKKTRVLTLLAIAINNRKNYDLKIHDAHAANTSAEATKSKLVFFTARLYL